MNFVKPIRFTRGSRKHRIGKAHALFVMNTAEAISDGDFLSWIGNDDRGIEVEVILVEKDDAFLVIHIMPTSLRRKR